MIIFRNCMQNLKRLTFNFVDLEIFFFFLGLPLPFAVKHTTADGQAAICLSENRIARHRNALVHKIADGVRHEETHEAKNRPGLFETVQHACGSTRLEMMIAFFVSCFRWVDKNYGAQFANFQTSPIQF